MSTINSNEQMIQRINEVLQNKKDAVVNIINDKLKYFYSNYKEKGI